jgi:hypothetical protein
MNAGTCWGKNTIGPSGWSVERPRDVTLPFTLYPGNCGISARNELLSWKERAQERILTELNTFCCDLIGKLLNHWIDVLKIREIA